MGGMVEDMMTEAEDVMVVTVVEDWWWWAATLFDEGHAIDDCLSSRLSSFLAGLLGVALSFVSACFCRAVCVVRYPHSQLHITSASAVHLSLKLPCEVLPATFASWMLCIPLISSLRNPLIVDDGRSGTRRLTITMRFLCYSILHLTWIGE